jgi:oxygen-dependent protoporphyrinogen oxidase
MTPPRVIVIGAGVTGLSCACELQRLASERQAPLSMTVLEAGSTPGGHARTVWSDGFLIEAGPNGFLSREPEVLALVEELGLRDRLIEADPAARRRFILRGNRLCPVPDAPLAFLRSPALSWRGKLRLLAEPWAPGPPAREETVHEFATRRIGREAADMLVDTAVSGISAGDSRVLSVSAQFPLMTDMEREHGGLFKAMIARRRQGVTAARLQSFDGGMGVLTQAMAARLGPRLRTGRPVRRLDRDGSGWRVVLDDGEAFAADHVVLATAARVTARFVDGLDAQLAAALQTIPYSGLAVVALGYRLADVPRPLDGYGYLVTRGEGLATLGVVWESSIFPGRAPAGAGLLRVFLGGARRPEIVDRDDRALERLARDDLQRVLGITAPPLQASVHRWPRAIAQYTLGHADRRARIADALAPHAGLHVCGTSYDGVSFNHAVKGGRTMARGLGHALWPEAANEPALALPESRP